MLLTLSERGSGWRKWFKQICYLYNIPSIAPGREASMNDAVRLSERAERGFY